MELESLKRQLAYLENGNIKVSKLVTDRHTQVSSFMAKEKAEIEHAYDVWHVAKGTRYSVVIDYTYSIEYFKYVIVIAIIFMPKEHVAYHSENYASFEHSLLQAGSV